MKKLIINGNKKLGGEISVQGAKNSVLPILAATILIDGKTEIHNVPYLSDVDVAIKILKYVGAKVERFGDVVTIDSTVISKNNIPEEMMREMRSSIIFLGSILSRCKEVTLCYPGGCDIGIRPVDLHIESLKKLGAEVFENGNCIHCRASKLVGEKIVLSFPSVGATENIIISSVLAKGKTTIINAAREPEIADLADFLNKSGANIVGAGEGTIEIYGVEKLEPCEYSVIPDRIVATTYMCVGVSSAEELTIKNVRATHLTPVFPVFREMGAKIYLGDNSLRIVSPKRLKRVRHIKTMPYPGFPTDCQSIIMASLLKAHGTSIINENIFESRFKHVSELKRFGADITVNESMAVINGVKTLYGANVFSTDLRGGAALVVAGLSAEGITTIGDIYHIDRGYEKIEENLALIGADIKRTKNEERTEEN